MIQVSVKRSMRKRAREEMDARREAFRQAAEWLSENEQGIGRIRDFARRVGEVAHERFGLPAVFAPVTVRRYGDVVEPFFISAPVESRRRILKPDDEITVREVVEAFKEATIACPDREFGDISVDAARIFGLIGKLERASKFIRNLLGREEDGIEELRAIRARYDYRHRRDLWYELGDLRYEIHAKLLPYVRREALGALTDKVRGGEDELIFLKNVIDEGYIPEVRARGIDEETRDYLGYFHIRKSGGGESFYVLYVHDAVDFSTVAKRLARQGNGRSKKWKIPDQRARRANLIKRLEAGDPRFPDVRYVVFYENCWSGKMTTRILESKYQAMANLQKIPDEVAIVIARIDRAIANLPTNGNAPVQRVREARKGLEATIFMAKKKRGKEWSDVSSEAGALEAAIADVRSQLAPKAGGGGGGSRILRMPELCAIPDYAAGSDHMFFPLQYSPPYLYSPTSVSFVIPRPL